MTAAEALDPIAAPLTYPGAAPASSAVLVTEASVLVVRPSRTGALGEWRVSSAGARAGHWTLSSVSAERR